jgi:hypothetical protein
MIRKKFYRKKGKEPACVSDFLARTRPESASFATEMGHLCRPEIDTQYLQILCEHFASGVQYISDHYNTAPKSIGFIDHIAPEEATPDNPDAPFELDEDSYMTAAIYYPEDQSIIISRALLNGMLMDEEYVYFADDLRQEYPVTPEQYMFLLGIEEAYHHKQKFGGSKAQRRGYYTVDSTLSEDSEPWDDPQENEARRVVLEVARDVGIIGPRSRRTL